METDTAFLEPKSVADLQSIVRDADTVHLSRRETPVSNATPVSLAAFNRIVEYQPDEYTITVESGILVSDVQAALAKEGQYLPFDPPFVSAGTTIGAAIARGLSGPDSFRYGILRDFIIGVTFVDGSGTLVHTGGKVVKNAAGFDIPKLMSGSGGSFGVITEASFKVFPIAPERKDIVFPFSRFEEGHEALVALGRSQFTLDALDLRPDGHLFVGLSGHHGSLDSRIESLETTIGAQSVDIPEESNETQWPPSLSLERFPDTGLLLKIPIAPRTVAQLEDALEVHNSHRRYSIGGYVAWVHWTDEFETLESILQTLDLSAQVVSGGTPTRIIGTKNQQPFYDRLKAALDPQNKFPNLYR